MAVALAINQLTNRIYIGNFAEGANGTVTVINGADNSVLASFDIGGDHASIAIAIDSLLNTIYVANDSTNQVTVISGN